MTTALLVVRWVLLCASAGFLGIDSAAVWYGGANAMFGEPVLIPLRIVAWLSMSLAAVPEGFVLGGLQALGMRWFLPDLSIRTWILATIGVGFIGWAIGTFIPLFFVP